MLLSEHVFDDWRAETLLRYAQEQQLEWTLDDVLLLLHRTPSAPVGFLVLNGHVHSHCPYYDQRDLDEDVALCRESNRYFDVETTLALHHDDMCDFLMQLWADACQWKQQKEQEFQLCTAAMPEIEPVTSQPWA